MCLTYFIDKTKPFMSHLNPNFSDSFYEQTVKTRVILLLIEYFDRDKNCLSFSQHSLAIKDFINSPKRPFSILGMSSYMM